MKSKRYWMKKISIFIPIIILTLISYYAYQVHLTYPQREVLYNIMDVVFILHAGYILLLYLLVKNKVVIKDIMVYLLILLSFSFFAGIDYVPALISMFPFNIIFFIGKIMITVVYTPVYYWNFLNLIYNNVIQNMILFLVFVLFYYKYVKLCKKKPIGVYYIITALVSIINAQIGYQIFYIKSFNEWYQHGVIVGLTFVLWLGVIYRQRKNPVSLKILGRVGSIVSILEIIYLSPLFAVITELEWSYIAGLISFIPSITIPLFNIGGSMVRSSVVFWIISVVLMLLLTALSMYLYRKNYGKQKGDGSIEAEIKKTK